MSTRKKIPLIDAAADLAVTGTVTITGSGSNTYTMPSATDTLVGRASTDTLTNKTLISPIMTAPALGTPASGVATNLTGTAAGLTAGNATTLETARTINGTSFNGSANITVTAAGSTLSDTVTVAKGGTGRITSTTAYGLLAAGTTATGAHQTLAVGTSGQILKSNGAALPTFQTGAKDDVGLGNVDNTSNATERAATATLTNKTLTSPIITTPTIAQINNSTAPGVKLQVRVQTDNNNSITNTTQAGVITQYGWGQIVGNGTSEITDTVTFPTPFTTILGFVVTQLGAKVGAAADLTGLDNAAGAGAIARVGVLTNSTAPVTLNRTADYGVTAYYGFSWIAWGI